MIGALTYPLRLGVGSSKAICVASNITIFWSSEKKNPKIISISEKMTLKNDQQLVK